MTEIDGFPGAATADGQAYDTLTSSGVKEQGVALSAVFISEEAARKAYDKELTRYLAEHPGSTLVWRQRPECSFVGMFLGDGTKPRMMYAVCSRLAIIP